MVFIFQFGRENQVGYPRIWFLSGDFSLFFFFFFLIFKFYLNMSSRIIALIDLTPFLPQMPLQIKTTLLRNSIWSTFRT